MDGRGEPRHQPIAMLPTIAHLIDEGLTDTSEQYATLLEARPRPWVLDDALISRSKRVNGAPLREERAEVGLGCRRLRTRFKGHAARR